MKKEIYVRNLEKRDLPAIVSMEERQTGVARPDVLGEENRNLRGHSAPLGLFGRRDSIIASSGLCWGAPVNLNLDYPGPWRGSK